MFFRKQDSLTNDLQKKFILRLGENAGRPSSSTVHIHPMARATPPNSDIEIIPIASHGRTKRAAAPNPRPSLRKNDRNSEASWHSDLQFEEAPADYTSLRLFQLPKNGGDTLWASGMSMVASWPLWSELTSPGYDIYDRFSKPYQKFFESLTVTYSGEQLIKQAEALKIQLYDEPRGSPANVGTHFTAVHPLVRTHPVTG